jgi:hypothetical protein
VEFEGNIKKPDIDIWELIGQVLKNAFIQALYPSLENSVSLNTLAGKKDKSNGELDKTIQKSNQEMGVKKADQKKNQDKKKPGNKKDNKKKYR